VANSSVVDAGTPRFAYPALARVLAAAATLTLLMIGGMQHALAGGRVAMVLAAEEYANFKPSEAGTKRAEDIAEQLRARGFEAFVATNPANAAARAVLRDFAAKTTGADLAIAILMGHGLSSAGQTFFIPSNVAIERSTDLLSRGLSVTNIAQIVGKARAGGVCFFMTTPNFAKPVDGVDVKPQFEGEVPKTAATAFSNSAKIPISRMDAAAGLAANEVVSLLQKQPRADLRQLIAACGSQQLGAVFGAAIPVDLSLPPPSRPEPEARREPPPPPVAAVTPQPSTGDSTAALEALERLIDPRQVRRIQTKLQQMGLYGGPIDAVIGVLTRQAIKDYQRQKGVVETGFLTPDQLEALTR
jgi:hypothetical protein